ncbi:hypothetical protein GGI01_002675 [Coemansia sp. RSA 376]|nr:hypothetical protein LPJ71_000497 [Coemansia sp. S17]KAJ2035241.1 hypothetical protein H4S03_004446 [Coemansia sp. S3946]KAJ2260908.1 hypothetical protein GGI01_002675 [Coemansia sp. RSA 376]KAJ2467343.1 hypothetical protein GGI03_001617 [Coemansia sp. RSA 2337]
MSEYLATELGKLGVDDEAIVEYCVGLLEDTSMDDEEKHEAIVGYLEATESEQDFTQVVNKALELVAGDKAQRDLDALEQAQQALRGALEKEREELLRDAQDAKPVAAGRQLTAEERRQRERVLKAYDVGAPEIVEGANGESEIVYREHTGDEQVLERNTNAQIVADKERAQREANKAAHQKKKEREKELLEKDRLKKEKEKKRTMKGEKRRM